MYQNYAPKLINVCTHDVAESFTTINSKSSRKSINTVQIWMSSLMENHFWMNTFRSIFEVEKNNKYLESYRLKRFHAKRKTYRYS